MPTPTPAGAALDEYDELFAEWFEEDVEIRNWLDPEDVDDSPETDSWGVALGGPNGDALAHPDNPIAATMQIDEPQDPQTEAQAFGEEATVEAFGYCDDELLIGTPGDTDAEGRTLDSPTQVTRLSTGQVYHVTGAVDEGSGQQRVEMVTADQS